ncbi:MAG: hypothetical protein JJU02_02530 [Cryomorphaceae bacterium]|nr:hypothetical protein [Cryomorphaceae bacterium]
MIFLDFTLVQISFDTSKNFTNFVSIIRLLLSVFKTLFTRYFAMQNRFITISFITLFSGFLHTGFGQGIDAYFDRIELRYDTIKLNYTDFYIGDEPSFFLPIRQDIEEIELRFYLNLQDTLLPESVVKGKHYQQIDSLLKIGTTFYRVKLELSELKPGQMISPVIRFTTGKKHQNFEMNIYPYEIPQIALAESETEVFRGEEKSIEIVAVNPEFYEVNEDWVSEEALDYWLRRESGKLVLNIRGKTTGTKKLQIPTKLKYSYPRDSSITKKGPVLEIEIVIKPSRLRFLNADRENIFFDSESRSAGEIQLDYHPGLKLKNAYRIEDVNEGSGRLIAEIIPKSALGNDKILCEVYSYSHHRTNEGYLYVKDGGRTLAMTNFNVVNRPLIQDVSLMREGGDWTDRLTIYPGETVELRIRGNGLSISNFNFAPCEHRRDTTRISDRITFYTITVPHNIDRKKVSVFMNDDVTQYELLVREHKRPAQFDYISIDYGEGFVTLTDEKIDKPIFYDQTIKDITLYFDRTKIDKKDRFYGVQNLEIEIRIMSQDNKLLDIQTIRNIVVCPDETSPRHSFYQDLGCERNSISLNTHLLRKTFTLDAFDQVIINIRHTGDNGPTERVHIYAERAFNFDLDVSFPAGLLTASISDPSVNNFSGVSTAFMAQFKFYSKRRFGQYSPFQIGAGFLALNAFNFADDAQRDLGAVILASIVPVRRRSSFSFPIYVGAGYFFNQNQFIFLVGPGLQVRF